MKRWFYASLLFKSTHPLNKIDSNKLLWEECIFLINAETKDEAYKKAEVIGKKEEISYLNPDNDLVSWVFIQVVLICDICDETLLDGSELFSRFLRSSEAESILKPFDDEDF